MLQPAKHNATYHDVLDAPEHMRAEILDGRLYLLPRPALVHAEAIAGLVSGLRLPFQFRHGGPGGWRILPEPELRLGADVLVPDVAGWREAELEPGALGGAAAAVCPNWVCEVLSPSTAVYDRTEKRAKYLRHGVDHLWLVDPVERYLECFEANASGDGWILRSTACEGAVNVAPFDAVALDLSMIWIG
jgi:Uma2 family endonuclease